MRNKKIFKIYLLFVAVFLMSTTLSFSVNAASGCCAGHGGVKCSAGPDSDGSVICNDGWRDSGCSYSGMEKCKIPTDDSSSSNQSSRNINKNKNSNVNSASTINSKSNSLIEKILAVLMTLCFLCPAIPLVLFEKISDLFSKKQSKDSQRNKNRFKPTIKEPYNSKVNMICPRCGGRLIKKNGRYGYFYGCENYYATGCKYTKRMRRAK